MLLYALMSKKRGLLKFMFWFFFFWAALAPFVLITIPLVSEAAAIPLAVRIYPQMAFVHIFEESGFKEELQNFLIIWPYLACALTAYAYRKAPEPVE